MDKLIITDGDSCKGVLVIGLVRKRLENTDTEDGSLIRTQKVGISVSANRVRWVRGVL